MGESDTMSDFEGHTIKAIRQMTDEEMKREGWDSGRWPNPTVIELQSGPILYPSMDPEGNGPGAMFGYYDGERFAFTHD